MDFFDLHVRLAHPTLLRPSTQRIGHGCVAPDKWFTRTQRVKAPAMISVRLLLLTIVRTFSPRHTLRLLAVIHASQTYFPGGRYPSPAGR